MNKLQALVVDDEWNMRNLLRIYLTKNGFEVREAKNGSEAILAVKQQAFDILILDLMMPDMDGWEVCSKIRETNNMPIIMLTARTETKDKIHGLNAGADDYLVKPFEPEELIARVFALIRRSTMTQTMDSPLPKIEHPNLIIFPEGRQVMIQEQYIELQKEFDLLRLLVEHPQRAYTRDILLEKLWGYDYLGDVRTVDIHIKNIREKVQKSGLPYNPIIQTVWGVRL